jgi:hypothetical protein
VRVIPSGNRLGSLGVTCPGDRSHTRGRSPDQRPERQLNRAGDAPSTAPTVATPGPTAGTLWMVAHHQRVSDEDWFVRWAARAAYWLDAFQAGCTPKTPGRSIAGGDTLAQE